MFESVLISKLALYLGLTIIIELAIALLFGYRDRLILFSIVLINIITNPAINFLLYWNDIEQLISNRWLLIGILEVLVIFIEAGLLTYALRNSFKEMLKLSLLLNAGSFGFGIIILSFL